MAASDNHQITIDAYSAQNLGYDVGEISSQRTSGYGIAERPHVHGTKPCVSGNGCKLGDGRKLVRAEGCCGLCGGRLVRK